MFCLESCNILLVGNICGEAAMHVSWWMFQFIENITANLVRGIQNKTILICFTSGSWSCLIGNLEHGNNCCIGSCILQFFFYLTWDWAISSEKLGSWITKYEYLNSSVKKLEWLNFIMDIISKILFSLGWFPEMTLCLHCADEQLRIKGPPSESTRK